MENCQDMLQCTIKDREEEDCKLVNMDVNNVFMEKEILSTHLSGLKDTQCILTLNVNIIFVGLQELYL